MIKKTLIVVLVGVLGFGVYKTFFTGNETVADMCIKVANKSFKEKYGRVPSRDDFVDESIIQKDWYPIFEKCLDENQ